MLPGESPLPEWIVACPGDVVNRLFVHLAALYDQTFPRSYGQRLRAIQLLWLSAHRGRLRCPRCDGTALIRKGWRSRVLRTSLGRLSLAVLQMRCKCCGRTFRPVNAVLRLPFGRRFLDELVEKCQQAAKIDPFPALKNDPHLFMTVRFRAPGSARP